MVNFLKNKKGENILFWFIFIIIVVIVFIYQISIYVNPISKEEKKQRENRQEELNAKKSITLPHFYGLPLVEGSMCNLFLCDDKIVIESKGTIFNLSKDKIIDVAEKTETEIRKSYTSSVGGAIGGAVLFGPIGAIIGGRTKEKTDKEEKEYLIFTYKDNQENKYISFLVNRDRIGTFDFIVDFAKKHKEKEINL